MERPNEIIFVFGSNTAGRHGKGAALDAKIKWKAKYGVGEGPTGSAYALPTKDHNLKPRSLEEIGISIDKFIDYAIDNPHQLFILTAVGTGLAGYSVEQILSKIDVHKVPMNIMFTPTWIKRMKL